MDDSKMKIGFDTGFFIELLRGHPIAIDVWKELEQPHVSGVISCLTLFELERLSLKGALKEWSRLNQALNAACWVVWLNTEIISRAAKLSHGLGMPAMDAVILASMLHEGVESIYTTDSHLKAYKNERVQIINLREGSG